MPSSAGPNTFGEENLVFGYDLGDVSNSYKGEPTTNTAVINEYYTYWNNSGTASWSNNDTTVPRLFSDLPVMSMYKLTNGNSHLGIGLSNQVTTSTEYTYSVYVWIPSSNSLGMAGSSPYFRPQPANYGAVTLRYNGSTSWGTWPRDQWIRISGTATTQSTNVTTAYISCYLDTAGDKVFLTSPQMEQKGHVTPFTRTSRSATQGLIDLKGTSTIDLTNLSFDSNAQMTFDGTDDWLNIPVALNAGNFTYETVMQASNASYEIFSAGTGVPSSGGTTIQAFVNSSGALINLYAPVGGSGWQYGSYNNQSAYVGVSGAIRHITVVNLNTNWKTYVNGVLVGDVNFFVPNTGNAIGVARAAMQNISTVSTTVYMSKVYNRALTAQEVASNFNAIKSRFSI